MSAFSEATAPVRNAGRFCDGLETRTVILNGSPQVPVLQDRRTTPGRSGDALRALPQSFTAIRWHLKIPGRGTPPEKLHGQGDGNRLSARNPHGSPQRD